MLFAFVIAFIVCIVSDENWVVSWLLDYQSHETENNPHFAFCTLCSIFSFAI